MAVEISSGLESVDLAPSIDFLFGRNLWEYRGCQHNVTPVHSSVLKEF